MSDRTVYPVGLARCESYDPYAVREAVRLAVERAGGLPSGIGSEVLLKPNLLSPCAPDQAVTTHPQVLRAVVGEIRDVAPGVPIHLADNPGYIFTNTEGLLERTGVGALRELGGVTAGLLLDQGVRSVRRETFRTLEEARISARYLDAPYCVNVSKLKTHVETEMTGCIKNIFGTADTGSRKSAHRSRSKRHLAHAICDLYSVRPPEFHVMDAIYGMEGVGPSHGRPIRVGWVLAGVNALAVDWAACVVMGYADPRRIPLIDAACERGLGPGEQGEVRLVGAEWNVLPVPGFKKSTSAMRFIPTFLRGLAHELVAVYPKLEREKCVRCMICTEVCPVDAIAKDRDGYPCIDMKTCVRCLCCHEMCPPGAMVVAKNLIARVGARMRGG